MQTSSPMSLRSAQSPRRMSSSVQYGQDSSSYVIASSSNDLGSANGVRNGGETKTLNIIQEFKQLYEDKMKLIDAVGGGDCNVQAKLNLQQDWIRDLTEQNEMLVRAVEELEQEATERVLSLEEKLKQSSKSACEVMNGYKNISINLEESFRNVDNLQSDVLNLVEFVRRIREEGCWSVHGLSFNHVNKYDLIANARDWRKCTTSTDDNKIAEELKLKEQKIKELEKKLEDSISKDDECQKLRDPTYIALKQSMLDMRDALTAEVADKHDMIISLKRDVQLLEEQCRKADQQTHFKDDIIKELRKEIKQLKQESVCAETAYLSKVDRGIQAESTHLINSLRAKCSQVDAKVNLLTLKLRDGTKSEDNIAHRAEKGSPTTTKALHKRKPISRELCGEGTLAKTGQKVCKSANDKTHLVASLNKILNLTSDKIRNCKSVLRRGFQNTYVVMPVTVTRISRMGCCKNCNCSTQTNQQQNVPDNTTTVGHYDDFAPQNRSSEITKRDFFNQSTSPEQPTRLSQEAAPVNGVSVVANPVASSSRAEETPSANETSQNGTTDSELMSRIEEELMIINLYEQVQRVLGDLYEKDKELMNLYDFVSLTIKRLIAIFATLDDLEERAVGIHEAELDSKLRDIEDENRDLRVAVDRATAELENFEKKAEDFLEEKHNLEVRIQLNADYIRKLEAEKEHYRLRTEELKASESCRCHESEEYRKKYEKTVAALTDELEKTRGAHLQTVTLLNSEGEVQANIIEALQKRVKELLEKQYVKPEAVSVGVEKRCDKPETVSVGVESSYPKRNQGTTPPQFSIKKERDDPDVESRNVSSSGGKRNRGSTPPRVSFCRDSENKRCINISNCDCDSDNWDQVNIIKEPQGHFTTSPSTTSNEGAFKSEAELLEGAFLGLRESVNEMMAKEEECNLAKKRICELEHQVQNIYKKDQIIGIQNDTLNIVENELQAWRMKELEVEAARNCREREINNLKETIDTLVRNLENEKTRSKNLQKAVDLYQNSVNVLQMSEEQHKKEITEQKVTISNLQEALVKTKHSLEDYRLKTSGDCCYLAKLVEVLRDENLQLEVDLFYNCQDIQMYEMRALKYQHLYREIQAQCIALEQDSKALERHKEQQTSFVDELSEQLLDCQEELKNLFSVLTEEQAMMECESVNLTGHVIKLQQDLYSISEKLSHSLQCLEMEKNNNSMLIVELTKRDCETMCLKKDMINIEEKLKEAHSEINLQKGNIEKLQAKLDEYEKSITVLDEESGRCQEGMSLCIENLNDVKKELQKKTEEYESLNALYVAGVKRLKNTQDELQDCRSRYDFEVEMYKKNIAELQDALQKKEVKGDEETSKYVESLNALKEEIVSSEKKYKILCDELSSVQQKLFKAEENELKVHQDYADRETEMNVKLTDYENEQERLIAVVSKLEERLAVLEEGLQDRENQLDTLKGTISSMKGENGEQSQLHQEEVCGLKNELNAMIQKHSTLKAENENLQSQVTKFHSVVEKIENKNKLMVRELELCLSELQTMQSDREYLLQRNQQLTAEVQSLQEACQSKTESVVTLEMELCDTKSLKESLCNESRNVISNVKAWLQEQRKINYELHNKIKQKNSTITKLSEENQKLQQQLNNASHVGYSRCVSSPVLYQSPPHPNLWSLGSVESACSSDSDWDASDNQRDTPQVFIHRVESLTQELQKSNRYWKNKMNDQDYTVSKDKQP